MVDFSIQPPQDALDELIRALGSGKDLEQRSQLSQTEKRELTLTQVLPGTWHVQLNVPTPFGVMPGQMMIRDWWLFICNMAVICLYHPAGRELSRQISREYGTTIHGLHGEANGR